MCGFLKQQIQLKQRILKVPAIICDNVEIRHCAFIRGNAIVGKNAVVGNSTELKNVILFDNVQVPHYNYVGDSILGYKAHMGAGSITSNVKSDKKLVIIKNNVTGEMIETNRKKVGAMLGDFVEIGLWKCFESRNCYRKKYQYISCFLLLDVLFLKIVFIRMKIIQYIKYKI